MATIDHLHSRLNLTRWVKRKPGEIRRVLACYECNQQRALKEAETLSAEEINRRSKGYAFNPKGKPVIVNTLETINEVVDILQKGGILQSNEKITVGTILLNRESVIA